MIDSNPTMEMRSDERLDMQVVDELLKQHIDGIEGEPQIRQFSGGSSNLTYLIRYARSPADRGLVLRRPPFGTRPKSGHSMIREVRVMQAIKPQYPAVPRVFFHQTEEQSPIGAEFYVMEEVPGHKMDNDFPDHWQLSEQATQEFGFSFLDKLIELHAVDIGRAGLSDFGRPEGYIERQILGWNRRYEAVITDDVDAFDDVRKWLETNRPRQESGASILHGDFRLDNVIVEDQAPHTIKTVLDWEISALGDPLMDLGNAMAYWLEASDPADVVAYRMQPSQAPGMPTRRQMLDHYSEKSGRDTDDFDFYLVAGVWRLAAILQQIYYRYYHGQSSNEKFANFGQRVNALGQWARVLISNSS